MGLTSDVGDDVNDGHPAISVRRASHVSMFSGPPGAVKSLDVKGFIFICFTYSQQKLRSADKRTGEAPSPLPAFLSAITF